MNKTQEKSLKGGQPYLLELSRVGPAFETAGPRAEQRERGLLFARAAWAWRASAGLPLWWRERHCVTHLLPKERSDRLVGDGQTIMLS